MRRRGGCVAAALSASTLALWAGCPALDRPRGVGAPDLDFSALAQAAAMALDLTDYRQQELSEAELRQRHRPLNGALVLGERPDLELAYMLVADRDWSQVTIALPGSTGLAHLALALEADAEWDPELGVALHGGFRRIAAAVRDDLAGWVPPHARVRCVGYSMGGAAAVILAAYLRHDGRRIEEVLTFGQPRLTDAAGAAAFAGLPLLRVVALGDPIAARPGGEYAHFGDLLLVADGPRAVRLSPGDPGYALDADGTAALTDLLLRPHSRYRQLLAETLTRPVRGLNGANPPAARRRDN